MTCTSLLLCDGTVVAPGAAFNSNTKLGFYRIGTDQMGVSVGANGKGAEFGNFTITNTVPAPYGPNTVRYTQGLYIQPLGTDVETAALYIRMNHSGTQQMSYGIYGEIDSAQNGVGGSFSRVVHNGAGDAHYVAHFGTGGIGYESASWANNTTGFLADVQKDGLSNAIMFNALWAQPTVPNYGMFVATAVPANALTISKYDLAHEGNVQIRITEPNYGADRFEVFGSGQVNQIAPHATSTTTLNNAPEHRLVGSYWNGSSSVEQHAVIGHAVDSTTPSSHMYFKIGPYGSEQYAAILSPGLLDLQGGTIANCNSIQSTAATTVVSNGHVVAQFSYDSVDVTGALALNIVSTNVATAGTATLPSNPLGFMVVNLNGTNVKVPYYAV